MADNKKYLDYAGLSEFWSLVKNYYSETVSKAASAIQGVSVKEASGTTSLDVINNVVTLDLTNYATKQDIAEGIKFKGVKDYESQLPSSGNEAGDVWVVKYRGESGTEPYGAEFIWVPTDGGGYWEELGNLVALDNYYTKSEVDGFISDEVAARNDAIETAVSAEAQARETADSDLSGRIDAEILDRSNADTELQGAITEEARVRAEADAAETEARIAADAAEIVARDNAIYDAFESGIYAIKLHEIRKLFGEETEVTPENFVESIGEAGLGDTLVLSAPVTVTAPIQIPANGDVTLDFSEGGSIDSGSGRALNVGEASTVEIVGGTVSCETSNYGIVCAANSSIIVDGTEIANDGSGVAIGTNGLNYNGDIIIRNATITGTNYFPACGNLVIEDSTITVPAACADSCAIYCKSGSVTIRNSVFEASTKSNGDWIHNNNGYYGISCAAIFENCNYGGHGNMKISIDAASQFIVHDAPDGATYENFGILVIDYNGNSSESINIEQKYYHAEVSNKTAAPYVHFTTDSEVVDPEHVIVVVEEING